MATNTQRITALEGRIKAFETWKADHLDNGAKYRAGVASRLAALEGDVVEPPPPPPPPPPDPGTTPAFGSRPLMSRKDYSGATDVVIEGVTFRGSASGLAAIRLMGVKRAIIRNCDFIDVPGGVYAYQSEDVTLEDCRYNNITGPAQPRTGANIANFIQTNECNRIIVRRNKGKGGDTEDIVSFFRTSDALAEDNHFEGTNWTSGSGSGIALGDYGGQRNIARRNILVDPGQVGIFIAGGVNHKILDNIVIGQTRPKSNVGMYVWAQGSSGVCSGHEVNGNKVSWKNATGGNNPFWDGGNCGPIAGSNALNAALDIAQYRVQL